MRSIPNVAVISPADCTETVKATLALAEHDGPAYLRLGGGVPHSVVHRRDYAFTIGKGIKLSEGSDVTFVATGSVVSEAVEAAKLLSNDGVSVGVVDMHTIKPLDTGLLDEIFETTDLVVTVEEHNVFGGLGSAVAEYKSQFRQSPPQLILGVSDFFPHAGEYDFLLEQAGLAAPQLAATIRSRLGGHLILFDGEVEADRPAGIDDLAGYSPMAQSRMRQIGLPVWLNRGRLSWFLRAIPWISCRVRGLINNRAVPLLLDATSDGAMFGLCRRIRPELAFVPEVKHQRLSDSSKLHESGPTCFSPVQDESCFSHPDLALLCQPRAALAARSWWAEASEIFAPTAKPLSNTWASRPRSGRLRAFRCITRMAIRFDSHLMAGATMLVTERSVVDKDFWTFFNQRATSLAGALYVPDARTHRFSTWSSLASHDDPGRRQDDALAGSLIRRFSLDRGVAFFVMYGQTEATARRLRSARDGSRKGWQYWQTYPGR